MLILVKHATPVVRADVAARDWRLSPAGRRQCRILASRLAPYAPQVMLTSVEPKAVTTGRITAGLLGVTARVAEGLHEHDRTGVPLMPAAEWERSVRLFFANPAALVLGRETADQAWQRFHAAVTGLLDDYADRSSIAVVAHGTVISLFVARAAAMEPFTLWKGLGLPSFVVLDRRCSRVLDLVDDITR